MNNNTIYFAKLDENAKIPSKRDEDAGYDIYACFEEDYITINPHETRLIPTGISSAFSSDYVAVLRERGSNGSKGIALRSGVIDSGYRGQWFVALTNTNTKPVVILKTEEENVVNYFKNTGNIVYPYNKAITQALILPVPKMNVQEITYDELKEFTSERGTGALGSSAK